MKLNPDCIRSILLSVEDTTTFTYSFEYEIGKTYPLLSTYSHEEILYHIKQASLNGMFTNVSYYDNGDYVYINDLSPKAHEFLANIRSNDIWYKTKSIASKVGSISLDALCQISAQVVTNLISAKL